MAKKPLNLEEIAELRKCPYIASVMSGKITFTPEFKRVAHEQLVFGKPVRTILEEHGIDPDILGNARIYGMAHMLRQGASCETGFTDLRKQNRCRPAENTIRAQNSDALSDFVGVILARDSAIVECRCSKGDSPSSLLMCLGPSLPRFARSRALTEHIYSLRWAWCS